ncbi:hypothetical protein B0H15DRAFT_792090, partial [Mycena belliarum]
VEAIISSFLDEIRPELEAFINSKDPLPLWTPPELSQHAEFLTKLGIPASKEDMPDMLLHDLGSFKMDPVLDAHLNEIFLKNATDATSQNILLLNAPGSGKTRVSLEGLCKHWGFYFTCQVDSLGHGSVDMQTTINVRIGKDPCFHTNLPTGSQERLAAHNTNCELAEARLQEMLLARLIIFSLFCKIIGSCPTDDHKRLWVILQIRPKLAGKKYWDLFETLTGKIKGIEERYLVNEIQKLSNDLRNRLATSANSVPFFCVVDEAQVAASGPCALSGAFVSSSNSSALRPILREVAHGLIIPGVPIALNITGTGMDKEVIDEVFTSAVLKARRTKTVSNIGAFDNPKEQRRYMERLLPPCFAFPSTPENEAFFARAFHWLRGRYRFTSTFLQELLHVDFMNPHKVLNSYVMRCTQVPLPMYDGISEGFHPSDGQRYLDDQSLPISKIKRRLVLYSILLNELRNYTRKYWMRSNLAHFPMTPNQYELVSIGFARYSWNVGSEGIVQSITINEPIAVLVLTEWLKIRDVVFAEALKANAAIAITTFDGSNGLEEYLAFYFNAVFDDKTRLDEIFDFHPDHIPSWAQTSASLVSLYYVKKLDLPNNDLEEGRVLENSRPSVCIGYEGPAENVIKWLNHHNRAPFCFPDKNMGLDIIFILKLNDTRKSLIWVAVQSKFHSGKGIFPLERLKEALSSLKPNNFFMETMENNWNELRTKVLDALDALPGRLASDLGTEGAGLHSVLRVIVTWPGYSSVHERCLLTSQTGIYMDEEMHPVAEINIEHWEETMNRLHPRTRDLITATASDFFSSNQGKHSAHRAPDGQPLSKKLRKEWMSPAKVLGIQPIPLPHRIMSQGSGVTLQEASVSTYASSPPPSEDSASSSPFFIPESGELRDEETRLSKSYGKRKASRSLSPM